MDDLCDNTDHLKQFENVKPDHYKNEDGEEEIVDLNELTKFCETISELGIFKSSQSCRNALSKAEKKGLIIKEGKNKKTISLNPDMNIQTEGTLFLDFKILGVESKEL